MAWDPSILYYFEYVYILGGLSLKKTERKHQNLVFRSWLLSDYEMEVIMTVHCLKNTPSSEKQVNVIRIKMGKFFCMKQSIMLLVWLTLGFGDRPFRARPLYLFQVAWCSDNADSPKPFWASSVHIPSEYCPLSSSSVTVKTELGLKGQLSWMMNLSKTEGVHMLWMEEFVTTPSRSKNDIHFGQLLQSLVLQKTYWLLKRH